jgi:hypothetical protein
MIYIWADMKTSQSIGRDTDILTECMLCLCLLRKGIACVCCVAVMNESGQH